ncbi:MAG: hypothetical protein ABI647_09930 [Gemmatimonadota bacterium]
MLRQVLLLGGVAAALTCDLAAQSTGTPVYLSPYRSSTRYEFGASLSDPGAGQLAFEGFYRSGARKYDFGFRGGVADQGNTTAFLAGADFRLRVIDQSQSFPLDGSFTVGVGGRFGDGVSQAFIPFGISLGRRIDLEDSNVSFIPYVHPVLGPTFGDRQSELLFGLGVGVDVNFNKKFELRVSGGLGDFDGVAISFAILR